MLKPSAPCIWPSSLSMVAFDERFRLESVTEKGGRSAWKLSYHHAHESRGQVNRSP